MAILIAIAIPVFSAQLEKAREAVDEGNLRSALSEACAMYLLNGEDTAVTYGINWDAGSKSISAEKDGAGSLTSQSTKYKKGTALTVTVEDGKATSNSWE